MHTPRALLALVLLACAGDDTTHTDTDTDTDTDTTDTDTTDTDTTDTGDTSTPPAPGDLVWLTSAVGDTQGGEWFEAVTALDDGTVVAMLRHSGAITVGDAVHTTLGGVGVLAVGLDPDSGDVLWVTELGDVGGLAGGSLSVAPRGTSVVVVLQHGSGAALLGTPSTSPWGLQVVELDATGTASRLHTIQCTEAPFIPYFPSISLDDDGTLLISAQFAGSCDVPAPGGAIQLTSAGQSDLLVARLADDGAVWARSVGGPGQEWMGATTLIDGGYVMAGGFSGTVDFGGASATASDQSDPFVARFTDDGSLTWLTPGATDGDAGADRVVVTGDGGIVAAGEAGYRGASPSLTFGSLTLPGDPSSDAFLVRLDPDTGEPVWLNGLHSEGVDLVQGLAADPRGGVVVAAQANALSTAGATVTAEGGFSQEVEGAALWTARYLDDGTRSWERLVDLGTGVDAHVLPDGSPLITGDARSGAVFGAGEPGETTLLGDPGSWNAVVLRLAP